jgi:hypothetical protein
MWVCLFGGGGGGGGGVCRLCRLSVHQQGGLEQIVKNVAMYVCMYVLIHTVYV